MKKITEYVLLLSIMFCFLSLSFVTNAQNEVPNEIIYALKTGNAGKLITFFNSTVELEIDNKENMYSLAQAEVVLKDFFNKNKPRSFEIKHQGGESNSHYLIGKLTTINGNFRTYLYLKNKNNKSYIHQLRFEENYE